MSEFTKGPWTVNGSHIYAPDGAILAQVCNPGFRAEDYPLEANARLIAAAPKMLAALQAVMNDCPSLDMVTSNETGRDEGPFELVYAAITDATGIEP